MESRASTINLVFKGIALLILVLILLVGLGYGGYYIYKKYFKPKPPGPGPKGKCPEGQFEYCGGCCLEQPTGDEDPVKKCKPNCAKPVPVKGFPCPPDRYQYGPKNEFCCSEMPK